MDMKKICILISTFSFLFVMYITIVLADTIILKSGKEIEGKIIEETDEYVKIDIEGVPVTYFSDEVDRIEKGSNSPQSLGPESYSVETILDRYSNDAMQYFKNKQYKEASQSLNKLIEVSPNEPNTYRLLGIAYYYLGRLPDAKVSFEKAISLEPNHPDAYLCLGLISDSMGLTKETRENLAMALQIYQQEERFIRALFVEVFLKKITVGEH